ncbi:MAG: AAA family ATPase [Dehalococcoidia bacterium]|nr:AAA family ATPase [Dehalococcoidia bacterium]
MGRNQQVLIVDADVDHRAQVKQTLGSLEYAVVGEATYGIEASRLAGELRPEIVLVHVEEPLALAFRTLEVVQAASPRSTVVVISQRDDAATAHKAILAGARGYIVSPTTPNRIDQVLRAARTRHADAIDRIVNPVPEGEAAPTAGFVVTVFGPKGGVGKTTLATNLAITLARRTRARVVVVDTDAYFGDVALTMGIQPERTIADLLAQVELGQRPDVKSYLVQHPSGVWVLPARHAGGVHAPPDADAIAGLIRSLATTFDFVVVDTPGAFGPSVAAALDESTTALLVTSADMASVKDARIALDSLRDEGFEDDRLKLVVNHATNANSITDEDIARTVRCDVFWTIPHDREVPLSTQRGEPLVIASPRAQMARRIEALAALLSGATAPDEADNRSVLGGLFRRGR